MIVPETYFTVEEELRLFGMSCLLGAGVGTAYDVLRAFRLIFPHNSVLVAIEDAVFLTLYGAAMTAFAVTAARGELRLYHFIGSVIGFVIYYMTVGSVIMGTLRKLFGVISAALKIITKPLKAVFAFLRKKVAVEFVGNLQIIVKSFKKIKIVLLNRRHLLYNKIENKKRKNVNNVVKKNET